MYPREVAEVSEVFYLSRGVGLPLEGASLDHDPVRGLKLGDFNQWLGSCVQRHPNQAVTLLALIRSHSSFGRDSARIVQLGNARALAICLESPPMVGALDFTALHPAQRKRSATMDAEIA